MLLAPPFAQFALQFGPPEYFTLMLLGLTILIYLAHGSMPKALLMAAFGIVLGLIGLDTMTARPRFTFDIMELLDGIGLVPIVMGLFGVSEVLLNIEQGIRRDVFKATIKGLLPTARDWTDSAGPIARGSLLGFFLGCFRAGGRSFRPFSLTRWRSGYPNIRSDSARGPSRVWPDRNQPTMRPQGERSSR